MEDELEDGGDEEEVEEGEVEEVAAVEDETMDCC